MLTTHDDGVECVEEIGIMWADMVAEALGEEPHRQAETLRAAYRVVERLLDGVPAADRRRAVTPH